MKRVLVLNSYAEGYNWTDGIMDGIHSVMDEQQDVELFINYMDTKRVSDNDYYLQLLNLYQHKYRFQKIDAIISTDNNALNFLLKYRDELFPDVPVFFNGVNDYQPSDIEGHNLITGITETYDAAGTVDMMLGLHPTTKEIVVVSDATTTASLFRGLIEHVAHLFSDQITFTYLTNLGKDELSTFLNNLPNDALVLWTVYARTPEGESISIRESVGLVSTSSNVPTYTLADSVGFGVVGGKIINSSYQGEVVAQMALKYLRGEPLANMPVLTNPPLEYRFDFNAMQRFGIVEKDLPLNSQIINKPFSTYEAYKWKIWSIIASILVLVSIIIMLVYYIKKRSLAEEALTQSEHKFRIIFEQAAVGVAQIDSKTGEFVKINKKYCDIVGYTEAEMLALTVPKITHPDDLHQDFNNMEQLFNREVTEFSIAKRYLHKNGTIVWVNLNVSPMWDDSEEPSYYVGVVEDITDAHKLSEQLSHQASHDALTGLVNRREFELRAEHLISTVRKDRDEHALCFIDIDQFKVVNDTCGHIAGDEMLRQISKLLQDLVRQRDTLARLGGDEFGVLMKHCSLEQAQHLTTVMQKTIQDYHFVWEGYSFNIEASMGLVPITKLTPNLTEVLKNADAACYVAKDMGRNRLHVYHPDDAELAQRQGQIQWISRLNQALEEDRFCLYAQPIVPLDDSNSIHYEILIRKVDENGKIIPPGGFLPAAERYNLITQIDRWVITNTFRLLAENPDFLEQIHFISINLSGQSLTEQNMLDFIVTQFNETGISGDKICFEITETAAILNLSTATTFISTLKKLGCWFALDDFGSGLSSFAYLKNLPVDYLKIDGMFVKDIVDDPIDHAMVKSINEIGQVMGMQTIAEFVENDEIKGMLREIGVNFAQGYGIGKPQPFEELLSRSHNVTPIKKIKSQ
ncbi:MAG: EAL domain-containing protein [Proteobacteria bacterium]|nr:EAL domain-containing protein [Pseudomonadota bacterium]